ncbi:MAG TPA: helix-turn-helix domain-containing protein [Trebonia sp.]
MTADGSGLPKYARVAAAVRQQVADGTLRPGQPAPSGAELSRATGYSTLTCRRALRELIVEGILIPGASANARPRVAGGPQRPAERDLAAASRALSAGLAARRRANGLTQPGLAGLAGVSVTLVGHAETGRLWQSRQFWERADAVLGAGGELLGLHNAYREAGTVKERQPAGEEWPEAAAADPAPVPGETGPPAGASAARDFWQEGTGPAGLARVTIVWTDGTVTTVHPPQTVRPQATGYPETTSQPEIPRQATSQPQASPRALPG